MIGETSLAAAEEFLGHLLWETETHYPGTTVLRWANHSANVNTNALFWWNPFALSKYTSGRTLIYSFSTDYLIKNPPNRCKGILAVRGEDVQVTLHHKMDISHWWYISHLESDWQTDKQRYVYCIFSWVIVIIMIMQNMHAGDDPRGGGHIRHLQDPALGRQTESEHLGRDREVRVFVFMARPDFRSGNITFFQANNLYCRHLDKVKLQEDFTKALTNQTSWTIRFWDWRKSISFAKVTMFLMRINWPSCANLSFGKITWEGESVQKWCKKLLSLLCYVF